MKEFKKQLAQVAVGTAVLDLLVLAVAFFIKKLTVPFVLGLLVGSLFEMGIFISMIYSTKGVVNRTPGKGQTCYVVSYGLRLLACAVLMYAAIKTPFISFWGVIIPLFYTKIIFVFIYTLGKESWR